MYKKKFLVGFILFVLSSVYLFSFNFFSGMAIIISEVGIVFMLEAEQQIA